MDPFTDNPFAVLTTVVAPAVLTNACSVLCLGTGNRIARVVDRSRELSAALEKLPSGDEHCNRYEEQLAGLGERAKFLFSALRLAYTALGCFAAAALVAVLGSASAFLEQGWIFRTAAAIGLAIGGLGVVCLVSGCTLMIREVQLALRHISEEAQDAIAAVKR
ncbi:MAG: DUF2721 domain-containing protein [Bryobacterales bacterium]